MRSYYLHDDKLAADVVVTALTPDLTVLFPPSANIETGNAAAYSDGSCSMRSIDEFPGCSIHSVVPERVTLAATPDSFECMSAPFYRLAAQVPATAEFGLSPDGACVEESPPGPHPWGVYDVGAEVDPSIDLVTVTDQHE